MTLTDSKIKAILKSPDKIKKLASRANLADIKALLAHKCANEDTMSTIVYELIVIDRLDLAKVVLDKYTGEHHLWAMAASMANGYKQAAKYILDNYEASIFDNIITLSLALIDLIKRSNTTLLEMIFEHQAFFDNKHGHVMITLSLGQCVLDKPNDQTIWPIFVKWAKLDKDRAISLIADDSVYGKKIEGQRIIELINGMA
jgi:hypothetical protein